MDLSFCISFAVTTSVTGYIVVFSDALQGLTLRCEWLNEKTSRMTPWLIGWASGNPVVYKKIE